MIQSTLSKFKEKFREYFPIVKFYIFDPNEIEDDDFNKIYYYCNQDMT